MIPAPRLPGLLAALLVAGHSMAADPIPAPPAGSSPWNTGTRAPAASQPAASGATTIRVFEGFGTAGPLYGSPTANPAYAIDVSAEFGTCANGGQVITAIQVGGTRYDLDARCPSGQVPAQDPAAGRAPAASAPPGAAMSCDPRTWNCRSSP